MENIKPGSILINTATNKVYGVLVSLLPNNKIIVFRLDKNTHPIFSKLEKIIVYLEKFKFLYFPSLYRIAIFLSYCRGYYDRNYVRIKKKNYWYE